MTKRPRRAPGECAKPFQSDLEGALEGGKGDVEALKDEITEWADSLESNNMEHLPKYEEVTEAKDALESAMNTLDGLDLPEHLGDLEANYTQDTRQSAQSRSGRMSNALNQLYAAKDAAQAWLDDNEELELTDTSEMEDDERLAAEAEDDYVTQEMVDERAAQREVTEQFVNDLEEAIGEAENVSFPGMY